MTEPTVPSTETVDSVTEFVATVDWRYVALAVLVGIAAGAAFVYLFVDMSEVKRDA